MVEFRGHHGTSASRANDIGTNGFQPSVTGRQGVGVYFWRENDFSHQLAIGWFKNARELRTFNHDPDRRCAVIYALITVGEDEWIDLNDPETHDGILGFFKEKGYTDKEDVSKLYEEFIALVEEEAGVRFRLVQTRIRAPKMACWPWQSFGQPLCYVVRDPSCITIARIDILENGEI